MIKNDSEHNTQVKSGLAAVKASLNIFSEEDNFSEKTWEVGYEYVHMNPPHIILIQSPGGGNPSMIADGIGENPNLTDNWDDAEGYYREFINKRLSG